MKSTHSLLAIAVAWCVLSGVAFGAMHSVGYKFSGTVTAVPPALASQFNVGELITGTVTLTQTVFLPDHGGGPISNLVANIGGDYPISSPTGGFDVLNDFGDAIDAFKLDANTFNGLSAPSVAGHTAEYLSFNLLYSGTSNLTSSNVLPQFIFSNLLDRSGLRFDGDDSLSVRFKLTDLSQVPEPGTLALAVFAAASLIASRRNPRRQ